MTDHTRSISWTRFPDTDRFLLDSLQMFTDNFPAVVRLKESLLSNTSTRWTDFIDHLRFCGGSNLMKKLLSLGYKEVKSRESKQGRVFANDGGIFPPIILSGSGCDSEEELLTVAISVADLAVFLNSQGIHSEIEGTVLSPFRQTKVWEEGKREFRAVERRAFAGFTHQDMPSDYPAHYLEGYQRWFLRQRDFEDPAAGIDFTLNLAEELVRDMGQNMAAWVVFAAERNYWQLKNRAGQVQKKRQDVYGLGWANHDHHTFRSSRHYFSTLLHLLSVLGFERREKFYAGQEAGWGAQVLEQPDCGLVVFADVDLATEELEMDFMQQSLSPRKEKGTVGLWCALHGESILQAGLHHLACRLAFTKAKNDLEKEGIYMLPPFSSFPFLKQAFTQGEQWQITEAKLRQSKQDGLLSEHQVEAFIREGVIGSHMENIQRDEGFKGFNQQSVSDIIKRTDPRLDFGAA
jgi:hypothetical protein